MKRIPLVATLCAVGCISLSGLVTADTLNRAQATPEGEGAYRTSRPTALQSARQIIGFDDQTSAPSQCVEGPSEDELSEDLCPDGSCVAIWDEVIKSVRDRAFGTVTGGPQRQITLTADQAIAKCLEITSAYPWEDENDPASGGPDVAHNCRDFTYGFMACMESYGYAQGHVAALSTRCQGCADGGPKAHRINLVRTNAGLVCPIDPQHSLEENATVYGECCNSNQTEAAECANRVRCTRKNLPKVFEFLCCSPGKIKIMDAVTCSQDSRSCYQDEKGNHVCPPDPTRCPKKPKQLTDCQNKIQQCLNIVDPKLPAEDLCKACHPNVMCPSTSIWDNLGR